MTPLTPSTSVVAHHTVATDPALRPSPTPSALSVLANAWRKRRNRWLQNAAFQRWAARFPLTRRLVRQRANALFDLCAGFVYSQVLLACVELKLLERLADTPRSAAQLAAELGLSPTACERLLAAAAALDLLEPLGDSRYGLGVQGAALLGNPGIAAMVEHHRLLYADLADPVALLRAERGEALTGFWRYREQSADPQAVAAAQAYSQLMAVSNRLVADDVLAAYPLAQHRRLLDVGGGEGAFLQAVAHRAPHLQLQLFDLPAVAQRAQARLAAAQPPLPVPVEVIAGSFIDDPLPPGADLITLLRVVHDHNDDVVRHLLRAIRAALAPGGVLLLAEPFAQTPGSERVGDAYFGVYLFAMGQGRPRSAALLKQFLLEAGFHKVEQITTARPWQTGLLLAYTSH